APDAAARTALAVASPQPLLELLGEATSATALSALLEILTRRYYKIFDLRGVRHTRSGARSYVVAEYAVADSHVNVIATGAPMTDLVATLDALARFVDELDAATPAVVDLYLRDSEDLTDDDSAVERLLQGLEGAALPATVLRVAVTHYGNSGQARQFTLRAQDGRFVEDQPLRGLHPMIAARLHMWRLDNFDLERLPAPHDVHLFHCIARNNPSDERLIAVAEVRDITPLRDEHGVVAALPELEQVLSACLDSIRHAQRGRRGPRPLEWNRVLLHVWPELELTADDAAKLVRALAPLTENLGLEQVMVQARFMTDGVASEQVLRMSKPPGAGLKIEVTEPPTLPLQVIDLYGQKVIAARRRGAVYPYELIGLLTRATGTDPPTDGPATFVEYDFVDSEFGPVDRPAGRNNAAIVVGLVRTPTRRYPEGMVRVVLLGDPTQDLGALAEPECRRIIAAIDVAEQLGAPVEWFAVSAGAKISMDSGTENMDWIGRVLRRIVLFTQQGGEINVVVAGINVGAQPYWNAEATMLMHTRGILVMTPNSAMVLTGKQALDYSGGVSAEDNFGIGGFDRVMGPNGQAQYWAPDLAAAARILFSHYEHSYVAPGERFPRRAITADPADRDVRQFECAVEGVDFRTVGEIFAEATNPGRKKPFDIRSVMSAVADRDHPPLERWAGMRDAEAVVVQDTNLGGWPLTLIGIESRPMSRFGAVPADGPSQWTAGTLFPKSSKKLARALNAASGSRPVVVLANLSGFDGSPESLRKMQLEYGAEIGRAVVNFDGPIVFCVVSRYHGGAFVVFSRTLNDDLYVAALEGSRASVIGGAPAAAVVFSGEVNARVAGDARVTDLSAATASTDEERAMLVAELEALRLEVRSQKLGEVADEFDRVHSIERAQLVGSVNEIVPAASLRPFLIAAVEAGMARTNERRHASRATGARAS
ncbi:MAG: ATP-grasp protein, partial [Acidimicrobiia bacterium]|nr:ATP-grasp protein [Acidimicrobiia bacterium]